MTSHHVQQEDLPEPAQGYAVNASDPPLAAVREILPLQAQEEPAFATAAPVDGQTVEAHWEPAQVQKRDLSRLNKQVRRGRIRQRLGMGLVLSAMGAELSLVGSLLLGAKGPHLLLPFTLLCVVVFILTVLLLMAQTAFVKIDQGIEPVEDIHAVGLLAEEMAYGRPMEQKQAKAALKRLLPHLNSSHRMLLSREQWECLYRRLDIGNASWDADFLVLLLDVLGRIGNAEALPHVAALAASDAFTPNGRRVRRAARTCLMALKVHAPHQEISEVLLRASNVPQPSADTLLRPAEAAVETLPEELLRADPRQIHIDPSCDRIRLADIAVPVQPVQLDHTEPEV